MQEVAVPQLTVLSIVTTTNVSQTQRLTRTVSLHIKDGQSFPTDLLVDTGSAYLQSILDRYWFNILTGLHTYRAHFTEHISACPFYKAYS